MYYTPGNGPFAILALGDMEPCVMEPGQVIGGHKHPFWHLTAVNWGAVSGRYMDDKGNWSQPVIYRAEPWRGIVPKISIVADRIHEFTALEKSFLECWHIHRDENGKIIEVPNEGRGYHLLRYSVVSTKRLAN